MRRLTIILVVALATVACAPIGGGFPEGRLVIVERDGAIVTVEPGGADRLVLAEAGATRFQPQWAPKTSRLAWGEESNDAFRLVISDADGTNRKEIATNGLPYYIHWAPDGERLIGLYNGPGGGVEARYIDADTAATEVLGSAIPYFFSWDPKSTRIVANRDGESLDIIEIDGSETRLGDGSLAYQAPTWSEAGIFHATGNDLILRDGGKTSVIARIPSPMLFVANSSGTKLAVQGFSDQPQNLEVMLQPVADLPGGVVHVVDTESGEVSQATRQPTAGFFWSPDGTALAMLIAGDTAAELQWLVWRDGTTTDLVSFTPRPDFVEGVLAFASQYAQSLGVWSPDSQAITFVGTINGEAGVWTQQTDGSDPTLVADGVWVSWSQP